MKEKPVETERRIRANDAEFNASFKYANNYITTSKYNIFTFIPKNLFEQLQRFANAYFVGLLILQLIPEVSSLTPITTIIPLVCVIMLTALKDAIDDILIPEITSLTPLTTIIPLATVLTITALKDLVDDVQRHRSDNQVNNRLSWVLRNGELVEERWHKVVVGDIIKMDNNQFVAADLLLLSTSEPNSLCYIETAELDGETNLKVRQAIPDCADMGEDIHELGRFNGEVIGEPPNNRLGKYEGNLKWKDKTFPLNNDNLLLRGCVLRNTRWCFGMVVFAGLDSKLMMNSGKARFKRTNIDRLMNLLIIGIFLFLLVVCFICMVACGFWESFTGHHFQGYLQWPHYIPKDRAPGSTVLALLVFLSYIIILNTVVPISLYVSVEVIRLAQSWWINWDKKLYYAKKKKVPTATLR